MKNSRFPRLPILGASIALFFIPLQHSAYSQDDTVSPEPAPSAQKFPVGVNGKVYAMAAQADGKIVIGGEFISVNNKQRQNLARMNPDGTLDETFTPRFEDGVQGTVYALAVDAQGRILVGGTFENAANKDVAYLARYLPDGTLDPAIGYAQGTNGTIYAVTALPDGGFAVGGQFTTAAGQQRNNFAVYRADLSIAPAPSAQPSGIVRAAAPLGSGLAAAGGDFTLPGRETQSVLFGGK